MAWSARSSGQGQAPALCLLLRYSPWDRLKMTAALKVSPAPRVSTTRGGGKASEWSSRPSGPSASAPSSAQAQTSVALRHPPLSELLAQPWPQPRPPPPGQILDARLPHSSHRHRGKACELTPSSRGYTGPSGPPLLTGTRSAWPHLC